MAISGAIACSIVANGGNVAVAVLVAILAGVVAGAWNGMLVAKVKIQPIVATMILMVAGRGIAQLITNGKIITINSDSYYFINGGYILGLPFPIFIVAFVVLIAMLFTKRPPSACFWSPRASTRCPAALPASTWTASNGWSIPSAA